MRIYHVPRARLEEHLTLAGSNPVFSPGGETPLSTSLEVGDLLQFLGYEIANPGARAGDDLCLFTYWRVLQPPPELAIFVHLLAQDGRVVAQYDGFDVVAADLAPGDTVVQMHSLQLPADLAVLTYRLELGAYLRTDLRISLSTGTDHVNLESWRPLRASLKTSGRAPTPGSFRQNCREPAAWEPPLRNFQTSSNAARRLIPAPTTPSSMWPSAVRWT